MFKTAMLVSALALSAPALAQDRNLAGNDPMTTSPDMPQTAPAEPATAQSAPTIAAQDVPAATADDAMPAKQASTPAQQTVPATPDAAPVEQAAAPASDPATPVTGATQIAQVVSTEFPVYDKNADTNLDKSEFAAWMVALKTASDPSTKASDPATVKWIDGAFASADADKSKLVSKAELTSYLSQGAE